MTITHEQAWRVFKASQCLYSLEEVEGALDRLAQEISQDLRDLNPLVLCVMNGGLLPSARLTTRMQFPLWLDYLHATRYREQLTGSSLQWIRRPSTPLRDRTLLVVDDILDEGVTLAEIVRFCRDEGAREVRTAVLVKKRHDRGNGFVCDYVGLEVDDRYVFGYGMDYHGYLRNAPGIYAVSDD